MDINQYFSRDSIFNDDSELSDLPDDSGSSFLPSTEEKDVYIPRLNLRDLQSCHSKYSEQEEDSKSSAKSVYKSESGVSKNPTIRIKNTENDFLDLGLYDTPPPPLPIKKRRTFNGSGIEGGMYRQSEGGQYKKRGSCPGFTGTWERDSLLHKKYDNLLANEGLEYSEFEDVSRSILSKSKVLEFHNRIYPYANDLKVDNTTTQNKRDSKLHNTRSEISIRDRDIRSPVCSRDERSGGNLLELESTFCVPAGCSDVSSIIPYDSGKCWVATKASKSILLYDRNGDLMDFVDVGCPVDSLATDKDGNVFMSCPDLKQVRMFDRRRQMRTFLDNIQCPISIAYTRLDDSILVWRNNKIANDLTMKACNPLRKYPIRRPKSSKPREKNVAENMCGNPFQVCVNVNDDCIVSDFAQRTITVLDRLGRIRYTFKSSKDFPIRKCHSLCCDKKGKIYIFWKGNPNVCVLEPGGNIKHIFSCCDLINESVFTSVFDSDDYLWVACMDGFIKIFRKY
ncbi:uncharacterized protein LOC133182515 [Saccostrea echinata]|uniref:uncharacterized protein LOC133182515 n=1 Tax=Saccostrea echinata TaxID=191078 RepID=UPI002A825905|nr:uncharacterized protein LOC133182515 [Saccostrea echinata]